jgi:sodium-coupled neutral amino acid transporter 11
MAQQAPLAESELHQEEDGATRDPATIHIANAIPGTEPSKATGASALHQWRHFEIDEDAPDCKDDRAVAGNAEGGNFGFFAGYFNFLNSIVGAGIIGLPFALNEAGIWLGLCMMLVSAWLTDYCVRMIIDIGVRVDKPNYELLCEHAWGRAGFIVCSLSLFGFTYGAMLAYLVIIGDTIPVLLQEWTGLSLLSNRTTMIVLCAVFICLPVSAPREIGKLANTSAVSVGAVVFIIIIIISRAPQNAEQEEVSMRLRDANEGGSFAFAHRNMFRAFGAITFAFLSQHSTFLVWNSLREPKSWNRVTHAAVGSATVLCCALSLVGYTSFRICTRGNILNNFYSGDQYANAARLALSLIMFFTYPMEFFVARQSMHGLLFYSDRHAPYASIHWQRHYALTFSLWLSTLLIALALPQDALGLILEYTGGICASMVGFVLPAGLAYHFHPKMRLTEGMSLSTAPRAVHAKVDPPADSEGSPAVRVVARAGAGGTADRLTDGLAQMYQRQKHSFLDAFSVACKLPVPTFILLIGLVSLTTSMYYAMQPKHTGEPSYCPSTGAEN